MEVQHELNKDVPNDIILNGVIIAGFDPDMIQIPLLWLRDAGFKGKIRIVSRWFGDTSTPVFEIDV